MAIWSSSLEQSSCPSSARYVRCLPRGLNCLVFFLLFFPSLPSPFPPNRSSVYVEYCRPGTCPSSGWASWKEFCKACSIHFGFQAFPALDKTIRCSHLLSPARFSIRCARLTSDTMLPGSSSSSSRLSLRKVPRYFSHWLFQVAAAPLVLLVGLCAAVRQRRHELLVQDVEHLFRRVPCGARLEMADVVRRPP